MQAEWAPDGAKCVRCKVPAAVMVDVPSSVVAGSGRRLPSRARVALCEEHAGQQAMAEARVGAANDRAMRLDEIGAASREAARRCVGFDRVSPHAATFGDPRL